MDEQALYWIQVPFSEHLGRSTQIFSGEFYGFYFWPDGFTVDSEYADDDPVIVDKTLETFNADAKIK